MSKLKLTRLKIETYKAADFDLFPYRNGVFCSMSHGDVAHIEDEDVGRVVVVRRPHVQGHVQQFDCVVNRVLVRIRVRYSRYYDTLKFVRQLRQRQDDSVDSNQLLRKKDLSF